MATNFLCGSTRNKPSKHQYSHSNTHNKRKRNQKHYRTSTDNNHYYHSHANNINTEKYNQYNQNQYNQYTQSNETTNQMQMESSISNLEEHEIINQQDIIEEELDHSQPQEIEHEQCYDDNSPQVSIDRSNKSLSYNDTAQNHNNNTKNNAINQLNVNIPSPENDFNLNYHGHIENHSSPRHVTSSNPFEVIVDQKKLHKIVKSVHYPYLSWHWFDNRFEPVIDVQRRKHDPGPVILRLDGKTYPKCIPCSRDNMDRELFDEETILNIMKWSLRHFICYCAEYNHDCTYMKKAKSYKIKLQQSIAQSKNLLREKMKLQKQNDTYYHQLSNMTKNEIHNSHHSYNSYENNIDIKTLKSDIKTYKESSKYWKKECAKEKKNLQNTTRDFQELLKKSNTAQMEYNQTIKQQTKEIIELNETMNELKIEIENKSTVEVQLNTLNEQFMEMTNDKNQLYEKNKKLNKSKADLKQKIIELQAENDTLEQTIEDLDKKHKKYETDLEKYKDLSEKHEKSVRNIKNQLKVQKNEFAELNDVHTELREKYTTLENELEQWKEKHVNMNELQLKHQNTMNTLQTELELKEEQSEKFVAIENKLQSMQEIENQLTEAQKQNETLHETNDKLQQQIQNHKIEISELNKQNKAAFALTMQHNLNKIKELEDNLNDTQTQNEKYVKDTEIKNKEMDEMNEKYNRQIQQIQKEREKDIATLRNRFNETKNNSSNKYREMEGMNHKLNEELDKLAVENNTISDELSNLENNNFELSQKNKQLNHDMNELKLSYVSNKHQESELHFAEKRKQTLKTESLQKQLAKVTKQRNKLLNEQNNDHENMNENMHAHMNGNKNENGNENMDELQRKYDELMTCYKQQKDELMQLRFRHSELEELHINNNLNKRKISMTSSEGEENEINLNNMNNNMSDMQSHSPPHMASPNILLGDDMDDINDSFSNNIHNIHDIDTLGMDTPTAIDVVNKRLDDEKTQSMSVILDRDNKLHPTWNLYDWYNKEQTLQVIDDIFSGDSDDNSVQKFFNSLRSEHGYIHEALVNNEWNIWQFVQECKSIDNYTDALKKLLDEHPRIYAAIHAEELSDELHELNEKLLLDDEYDINNDMNNDIHNEEHIMNDDIMNVYDEANDEEYKQQMESNEYYNNEYDHLEFIDAMDEDDHDSKGNECIHDFQTHPECAISFVCDDIGKIKLFQIKKNDTHLMKYAHMREDILAQDHAAYCCAISPLGEYVGFGGGYNNNEYGIIVCYEIQSKSNMELKFVIDDKNFKFDHDNNNKLLGPIYAIEFDENGQLLFVGNNMGDIWVFDVHENGTFIQNICCKANENKINDLCFYSNHIFILTDEMCFAYYYDSEETNDELPINVDSLQIISNNTKSNISLKHIGVASLGFDALIVYIASNILQYYTLPFDSVNNKIIIQDNYESVLINDDNNNDDCDLITSLHIDHKNEYVLISTNKNIKSYKIGNNKHPIKTIDRPSIAKCAVNYKYTKYVAICYEKPCSIEIKKFVKK